MTTFKRLLLYCSLSGSLILFGMLIFSCSPKAGLTLTTGQSTTTTGTGVTTVTGNPLNFQLYKGLAVKLQAQVTLNLNSTNFSYPTDFEVPQVPINWNGNSFSGKLLESGAGEDITDLVNGELSADRKTLVKLTYSRTILKADNTGISFQVVVVNVPLDPSNTTGVYHFTGSSLQSNVTSIQYSDGPVIAGVISPTTSYVSTDWTNTTQMPTFFLTFAK